MSQEGEEKLTVTSCYNTATRFIPKQSKNFELVDLESWPQKRMKKYVQHLGESTAEMSGSTLVFTCCCYFLCS